jgi:hypothetical protein
MAEGLCGLSYRSISIFFDLNCDCVQSRAHVRAAPIQAQSDEQRHEKQPE